MPSQERYRYATPVGVVLLLTSASWLVSIVLTGSAYGDASFAVGTTVLGFATFYRGVRGFVGAASLCSLAYAVLIVLSGISSGIAIIEPVFFAGCGLAFAYLWRSLAGSVEKSESQA